MFVIDFLCENELLLHERRSVWGRRSLALRLKIRQFSCQFGQLVQRVAQSAGSSALIDVGRILKLTAQVVVNSLRKVIQVICLRLPHGGGQTAGKAQRAAPLLHGAQHSLGGERRVGHPGRQDLVAPPTVVRQVAAVAAAKCTEVALVRLLPSVRTHMGF